ncbi:MAG: P-II family nitrogen regulator [Gracilimonas sp.]|nr:P-II family nitrogen regulator [Gracilimonas sp.]
MIIAEKILSPKICEIIESSGARGYTVVPAGGKGSHHKHFTSERASVVDDFSTVRIEVVVNDKSVAETIGKEIVEECFDKYSGIVYLEDVEILRPDKVSTREMK